MRLRPNHNADMPVPDDQIRGLRMLDALKSLNSRIKIFGIGVGIRETSALVDRMNQMRAVSTLVPRSGGVQRDVNHRRAIFFG